MKKSVINFFLDLLMIISLVIVGLTSWIMDESRHASFLGQNVVVVHHIFGIIFLVMIALHVILHLKMLWLMGKNIFKKKH
jgi:hypothetical protein